MYVFGGYDDSLKNDLHRTDLSAVTSALNGRPVLRFDGSNDWLALPTDSFDWAIGGNLSVFIAYNITDMSATRRMLTYWYNLGSILVEIGSTDKRQWLYCAGVGACSATNNDGYGSPKVLAGVFSDTANTIRVWNCGAAGTQITNNNSISFHADDRPTIGASRNSSNAITSPMKADIAAIIVYNRALSDAERQRVERWLATRYGITLA